MSKNAAKNTKNAVSRNPKNLLQENNNSSTSGRSKKSVSFDIQSSLNENSYEPRQPEVNRIKIGRALETMRKAQLKQNMDANLGGLSYCADLI